MVEVVSDHQAEYPEGASVKRVGRLMRAAEIKRVTRRRQGKTMKRPAASRGVARREKSPLSTVCYRSPKNG